MPKKLRPQIISPNCKIFIHTSRPPNHNPLIFNLTLRAFKVLMEVTETEVTITADVIVRAGEAGSEG